MDSISITVLIATYNRARMLERCLAHLSRQAFEPGDEIVVVDNGSTDGTERVINEVARNAPVPIRYVLERTPGKSSALATGVAAARCDVLALTDDDVVVGVDWITAIRRLWSERNPGLAGGRVMPLWERPAPAWLHLSGATGYGLLSAPLAVVDYGPVPAALGTRTALGANLIVSRAALEAAGGFPRALGKLRGTLLSGEDHQICERVQAAGYAAVYDPRLVVHHQVPAERLRIAYHLRWFFWSGITNAALDRAARAAGGSVRGLHWIARMLKGIARTVAGLLRRRPSAAAEASVEVAFSLGYLAYSRGWVRTPAPANAGISSVEAA